MNERRIQRIQELIKARVARVLDSELSDPRRSLITVTRVKVDRELSSCLVFWSVLGSDADRRRNARMLDDAARFVQREVAAVLHTRTVPRVKFIFDESIEGAQRVQKLLDTLKRERESVEPAAEPDDAAEIG